MKKVYGVGIGPGDAELITLKAYNLIRNCDYIFIPASKGESLAGRIVQDYTKDKKVIEIEFPMGEDNKQRYEEAAKFIFETLKENETAVFITLGDTMTYSTYIYLMMELQKLKVEVETVPGITSYGATASALNIPVTLKGEGFYLCDGEIDEEILKRIDSIAILKVNKHKEDILNLLDKNGFKYWYIRRCTQENQVVLENREDIINDNDYMSLIFARRA